MPKDKNTRRGHVHRNNIRRDQITEDHPLVLKIAKKDAKEKGIEITRGLLKLDYTDVPEKFFPEM